MPDDLSVTTALVSCCSSAATACMQPQRGRSMQWPAPEHGRGWGERRRHWNAQGWAGAAHLQFWPFLICLWPRIVAHNTLCAGTVSMCSRPLRGRQKGAC